VTNTVTITAERDSSDGSCDQSSRNLRMHTMAYI
jgi:hypothetical protein